MKRKRQGFPLRLVFLLLRFWWIFWISVQRSGAHRAPMRYLSPTLGWGKDNQPTKVRVFQQGLGWFSFSTPRTPPHPFHPDWLLTTHLSVCPAPNAPAASPLASPKAGTCGGFGVQVFPQKPPCSALAWPVGPSAFAGGGGCGPVVPQASLRPRGPSPPGRFWRVEPAHRD